MILVSAKNEQKAAPYLEALRVAGIPGERLQVVDRDTEPARARELAMAASGLVLSGGADVDPQRYGEEVRPQARVEMDKKRDDVEWALLEGAEAERVPVWAICRGLQVVNVYLRGTLWQDLPTQLPSDIDHYVGKPPDQLTHTVHVVAPETALGAQLGGEPPLVNSRHHQAVKDLAPGLVTAAVAPDGLIEAAELPPDAGWWLRAVQWHPENLIALDPQRELWRAFARRALGAR